MFYSQCGQDIWVNGLFNGLIGGTFVEIGAYDGVEFSNTCYFEKYKGWNGVCIEPQPEAFEKLKFNRKCLCVHGAVYDRNGSIEFMENTDNELLSGIEDDKMDDQMEGRKVLYTVPCYDINTILDMTGREYIEFVSLDTEGSEYKILENMDFKRHKVKCFCIENNGLGIFKIGELLRVNGYKIVSRIGRDTIYYKDDGGIVPYDRYQLYLSVFKDADGNPVYV